MTDGTPHISVLLTAYNAEDTIEAAVRSLLAQACVHFELIVVDDGSDDQTRERLARFEDPRVAVHHREHRGRAAALNTAVSLARGHYIAIADADDSSDPSRLSVQAAVLDTQPEIDIVGSWITLEQPAGSPPRVQRFPEAHDDIVALMPVLCSMPFPACMLRRTVFERFGSFDEDILVGEDFVFWLSILAEVGWQNIPAALVHQTRADTSLTSRHTQELRATHVRHATSAIHRMHGETPWRAQLLLGMLQYYHGSMGTARGHLLRSLWRKPTLQALRYVAGTLLGDTVMQALRRSGLAHRLGTPLRMMSKKNRYAAP